MSLLDELSDGFIIRALAKWPDLVLPSKRYIKSYLSILAADSPRDHDWLLFDVLDRDELNTDEVFCGSCILESDLVEMATTTTTTTIINKSAERVGYDDVDSMLIRSWVINGGFTNKGNRVTLDYLHGLVGKSLGLRIDDMYDDILIMSKL